MAQLGRYLGSVKIVYDYGKQVKRYPAVIASKAGKVVPKLTPLQGSKGGTAVAPNGSSSQTLPPFLVGGQPQANGSAKPNGQYPQQLGVRSAAQPVSDRRQLSPERVLVSLVAEDGVSRYTTESKNASPELLKVRAVWPFDFFPNELIVEEKRLVINERYFFLSSTVISIMISNIAYVEITQGLFFAGIRLHDTFGTISLQVHWLKRHEAVKAKQLIDGLIIKDRARVVINADGLFQRQQVIRQMGKTNVSR